MVELLVVIGIIALLVAILLPALSSANRSAKMLLCASNLRQIGIAMHLYADANKGVWPWELAQTNIGTDARFITWDDLIEPYLGVRLSDEEVYAMYSPHASKLFVCPADPFPVMKVMSSFADPPADTMRRSYKMVIAIPRGKYTEDFQGIGAGVAMGGSHDLRRINTKFTCKRTDSRRPSEQLMIVESPQSGNHAGGWFSGINVPSEQYYYLDPRPRNAVNCAKTMHGQKWNYLFVDTHVEPLRWDETVRDAADFTTKIEGCNYMWTRDVND